MNLYCDTCGKELTLEEGTLSWIDSENSLREFRITHKQDQNHSADPRHVAYIHLWIVTGVSGFVKFTELLADYWSKGYTLRDTAGLKKVLNRIGAFIWEKTKKQEV
ncbi:MAG TPA: hypothetical protein PK728_10440 [Bacillota bacterium]|nr:hypothetical protein [Bacillota bacterium]